MPLVAALAVADSTVPEVLVGEASEVVVIMAAMWVVAGLAAAAHFTTSALVSLVATATVAEESGTELLAAEVWEACTLPVMSAE
jgi:hypothetical protein